MQRPAPRASDLQRMPETPRRSSSRDQAPDPTPHGSAPGILESLGKRVLWLDPSVVVNIQKQLEATVGISARGFLYLAGARSGKETVDSLTSRPSRPEEFLRKALERFSEQGWGQFTLTVVETSPIKYAVTLRDSAIAASYGSSKKPVCHLLAGWLAGLAETLHGQSLLCDEVACKSQARSVCEFEVRPTPYA
jgi:uncharacterized protein